MKSGPRSGIRQVMPADAWTILEQDSGSVLVDVRTAAEWAFVGQPDISEIGREMHSIEWLVHPDLSRNSRFAEQLMNAVDTSAVSRILFICRSGARSLDAAQLMDEKLRDKGLTVDCVNVAEGFEGDLDSRKQRGHLNGWKAHGLPWRQS